MAEDNVAEVTEEEVETAQAPEDVVASSRRRLHKTITGTEVHITVVNGNNGEQVYDFDLLPDDIKVKLGPFAVSHKLGDAAAGKSGTVAEEAIEKVWLGMMDNDWSVRAPATPKVSIKAVADNFVNLDASEQEAAKALLVSLGIKIPGVTE